MSRRISRQKVGQEEDKELLEGLQQSGSSKDIIGLTGSHIAGRVPLDEEEEEEGAMTTRARGDTDRKREADDEDGADEWLLDKLKQPGILP